MKMTAEEEIQLINFINSNQEDEEQLKLFQERMTSISPIFIAGIYSKVFLNMSGITDKNKLCRIFDAAFCKRATMVRPTASLINQLLRIFLISIQDRDLCLHFINHFYVQF